MLNITVQINNTADAATAAAVFAAISVAMGSTPKRRGKGADPALTDLAVESDRLAAESDPVALYESLSGRPVTEVMPELPVAPAAAPAMTRADMLAIVKPRAIERGILWVREHIITKYGVKKADDMTDDQLREVIALPDPAAATGAAA